MADWGVSEGAQNAATIGASVGASSGTTISTPGSLNTKGAYTQLAASTATDAVGILVSASVSGGAFLHVLLDIAVGAAGSEQVVVADLHYIRISSNNMGSSPVFIPLSIPAGSRIAARYQTSDASASVAVSCVLVSGALSGPVAAGACATYGAVAATSRGTAVDPGATANTKGAYSEIVAATTVKTNFLTMDFLPDTAALGGVSWLFDVAIGPAGSEQVVIPNIYIFGNQTISTAQIRLSLPFSIPVGSRIAVRCQCSSNASGRALLVIMHAAG